MRGCVIDPDSLHICPKFSNLNGFSWTSELTDVKIADSSSFNVSKKHI